MFFPKKLVSAVVGSALAMLAPGLAFGQEAAVGRVRFGPLAFTPTLAASGIGVDNNVFNDAGERKSDLTATFSPQVEAWLGLGRVRFSGTSRLNVRYFKKYSDQGGTGTANDVRMDVISARFSPYIAAGYNQTYDRANLEIDTRAHQRGSTLRVGTLVRFSGRLSFDVAGERTGTSFDAGETFGALSLREQLNRTVKRLDVGLRYELTPLTQVTVQTTREATSFEFSPDRDSTATRVTGGFEFRPLALVSGTARIGVLRFRPVGGGDPVFLGPIAAVGLGYTLLGTTRLTLTVARELGYSVDNLQTYYLQTGFNVGVSKQIDEHWDVGANGGRQTLGTRSVLPGAVPLPGGGAGAGIAAPQDVNQYGATAGYRLSTRLRLGVNADRTRRSGIPSEEYGNVRIFGTVVYGIF